MKGQFNISNQSETMALAMTGLNTTIITFITTH